ncbi:MAG: bifunctional UDP-N-acetylglucosamine diphosphorylase/glucosamine-1-phosphate N-acetyltransferase GlmU [Rhodospirillales bacterium]|nr:bifunctional UDP-N-acetylglucosamine diphosphorylase/glucosamine-1-phosphate N-acetyltransferase GlmU [Rhodospirillales bacterium]MDE0378670.1 bifunctional UDP-N-acetylglucosamine diphosphorylase/glucosamine-1-phosphate N-acetyltransferase GlmU [Rhodospirillales bacterium]
MSGVACVVLAAGKGTRMRSAVPKVLHPLAGRPMVEHVLANARSLSPERTVLVIGPELEAAGFGPDGAAGGVRCVVQAEPLGTAHAVAQARPLLEDFDGDVIVVYADTPLVRAETLARLVEARRDGEAAAAVLGFRPEDPAEYGRLILASDGTLARIVEHAEAGADERAVTLCNAGTMAIDGRRLFPLLDAIGNENAKGEYYLTDLPAVVAAAGGVCAVAEALAEEVMGINDRAQLAAAERVIQDRLRRAAMEGGATLIDPATVWLSADTRLGADVTIGPNVAIGPGVAVDDGAEIRPFSHLEGVRVRRNAVIGPFARLRPGSDIGEGARVGNFVEVKNSAVEQDAKINHLSYVGDAGVGAGANIGAGTITCNYDGYRKSRTEIGEGAFIGSNTALVAPVTVGPGAVVGAGSVITEDVEADAIAVARGEQRQREGAAARRRSRLRPDGTRD